MILTFAIILTVGAILFTLVIRQRDLPETPPVSPTQHLEERKATIYENLRDVQFEYRVGKLSDQDYQATKTGLQAELAAVLAEIDRIQQNAATAPPTQPAKPAAKSPEAAKAKPVPGTACPHCGATFPQPLKFCGECGKAMQEARS